MASTRFAPDRKLTSRMLVVMFLLGLIYVLGITVAVAFVPIKILPFVVVLIGGFFCLQYFASDKIAMFAMHAKEVQPEDSPDARRLHAIVDRLCAMANMSKPRVALVNSDVPNAFATGRNQKSSVVCATTGIMRHLDDAELEGVIAHELSHVAHKDVAVMTIASFLGVLAGLLTRVALQAGLWGGFSDRRDSDDSPSTAAILFFTMIISAVVYAVSFLLIRSLSRYRELAADRSGALLTGNPSALSSALGKVTGAIGAIPSKDLRASEPFNAFFFTPALRGGSVSALFATHPSLEVRIDRLAKLSVELGR